MVEIFGLFTKLTSWLDHMFRCVIVHQLMLIFVGVGMCNQSISWSVACMISCAKNVAQVDALYLVFFALLFCSSCVFLVRGCKYMHVYFILLSEWICFAHFRWLVKWCYMNIAAMFYICSFSRVEVFLLSFWMSTDDKLDCLHWMKFECRRWRVSFWNPHTVY